MGAEERWTVSTEFPRYEVSSLGRIRHVGGEPRKTGSVAGYSYVCIRQGGKAHNVRLHRLIASAFIPNPEDKPYVNHKDGDRTNNAVDNLEWCTASENERHKVDVLGVKQKPPIHQTAVVCVETNCAFKSIKDAAEQMRINGKHIGEVIAGKRKTACGYHWRAK
jgi:hypothetical protein